MFGGRASTGSGPDSMSAFFHSLPMGTRLVLGLNAVVYVAGLCVPKNWAFSAARAPSSFCMHPRTIWANPSQWYRIFTSAFVHGGLMHIGFNMVCSAMSARARASTHAHAINMLCSAI